MNYINNVDFLNTIFGEDAPWSHVTDFTFDPNHIPKERHLASWKGDYFCRYRFNPVSNQYFTISHFYADEKQQARRRKVLYRHTRVIVLDDVKEKLSLDQVTKLPAPSWILETSPGSEQWGYILDTPCTSRSQVENLLDGLVANGLAPDGRDPGMKGVTRYVRLPEGYNTKASKMVNGQPFKCRMVLWQPFNLVSIQELARPFMVDLDAPRRDTRVDGAAAVDDHPLLNVPDLIHIKEIRSDGRFDITCPWVDEHTDADDSGAGVFTNADGTIGFKCHHGACQNRTGRDLLRFVERENPGFGGHFNNWKVMRSLAAVSTVTFMQAALPPPAIAEPVTLSTSFLEPIAQSTAVPVPPTPPVQSAAPTVDGLSILADALRRERPSSTEARVLAADMLKHVDELAKIDQKHWHDVVCDLMNWSKPDLKEILRDLRQQWYGEKVSTAEFYDRVLYVKELNQFYDFNSRIFFSTDAFQNSYSHEDAEARRIALQDGRVKKVDRLDYVPRHPRIFEENGIVYGNTYVEDNSAMGVPGDAARWLDHFVLLGWDTNRKHMLQWMAFTLQHPEVKINHMLLLGSGEGCGKDFLLYPLLKAMGRNSEVISGEELLSDFNDYFLSCKYLHINEAELGDRKEAMAISNKLKPIAAAPPTTLRVNPKGVKATAVRNIVNATMTTNSQTPIRLNGPSRRFYAVWSDMNPRDDADNMKPEWLSYWEDRWTWMKNGGYQHCIDYLRNQVDLSDFNPGAAPPMTQFLRDIRESSRSPASMVLENFIKKQYGSFQSDLLQAADMVDTLRAAAVTNPVEMPLDVKTFTTARINQFMSEIPMVRKSTSYSLGDRYIVWILRNRQKYEHLSTDDLYDEYERQMKITRAKVLLTLVK